MTTLDLRKDDIGMVDKIIFGKEEEYLLFDPRYPGIIDLIDDANGEKVAIYLVDIDNLIKALQKAKELWK